MEITLQSPLDMHLHLRDGAMLRAIAPLSARYFAGAVIMPNLVPPVDSLDRLKGYRREIVDATAEWAFEPYMTLFLRDYTEAELVEARPHILGIKLYPEGVTTHSAGGVRDLADIEPVLARMEELGIILMVHGETHGFVMDREREFMPQYERLAQKFPRLRIIMEHITTAAAVKMLDRHPNLFATVTVQHLLMTLDDMAGGMLNPHLFCKPILKRPEDRDALQRAALGGHPKLSFGSDSAPHPRERKESCGCAAGVFSAPLALPLLAEFFEAHGMLHNLPAFVSHNARRIYRIEPPETTVRLRREPMDIPADYGGVVPIRAGGKISWRVVEPTE